MKLNVSAYMAWPLVTALVVTTACGKSSSVGQQQDGLMTKIAYASAPYNFRVMLTDAPLKDAKEVNINIKSVELLLDKSGTQHRVVVGENIGLVDLLKLQNNVFKGMGDLKLPAGVTIREIRMILNEDGHHVLKTNGDMCGMKTPSAQKSGLKLKLSAPVTIDAGYSYVFAVDFDAEKSVVQRGNDTCLLKPVLHIKVAERAKIPEPTPTPAPTASPGTGDNGGEVTPSPTPEVPSDWFPTPDSGSSEPINTGGDNSGSTDGYTDTTSPTDPETTTPIGSLWN